MQGITNGGKVSIRQDRACNKWSANLQHTLSLLSKLYKLSQIIIYKNLLCSVKQFLYFENNFHKKWSKTNIYIQRKTEN